MLSLAGSEAWASTATGSFNFQVTIAATCVATGATALNFGKSKDVVAPDAYDPVGFPGMKCKL